MTRPLRERRPHDIAGPSYLAAFRELREREERRARPKPRLLARIIRLLKSA